MLNRIRHFFENHLNPEASASQTDPRNRLRLACAALMVELTVADDSMDDKEKTTLQQILKQQFKLDDQALNELWEMAQSEARDATSLYQFTTLINEAYDYNAKVQLLEYLWQVAFADGRIDPYEDNLIRKLTELLYLSHGDFIRAKRKVKAIADTEEDV